MRLEGNGNNHWNLKINLPIIPDMKNIGEKATIVVKIVVITGLKTEYIPSIEASVADSPFSRNLAMFSATIIPSSTIMPITIIRASKEMILTVISKAGIKKKTPMTATGIPNDTQKAISLFKKNVNTKMTKLTQ